MQSVIFHKQPAVARRDGVTVCHRSLFVKIVWYINKYVSRA